MARICAFCGFSGKLTGEHVFGGWLSRIGLPLEPTPHHAGPLNQVIRKLGVRPPFRQTVKDVCGTCNHGWMSQLEVVAQRVMTPLILGEPGEIAVTEAGAIAAWVQKTALTAMLVSSEEEREAGYGLPASEYRELWTLRDEARPLPTSQFWIGQYNTGSRLASAWVTPLAVVVEGLPEPDLPQGYSMTILVGQLVLHGVRFTTPSLQVEVTTRKDLPQLWPVAVSTVWPGGAPIDDALFLYLADGKAIRSTEQHIQVRPWKPATELPESRAVGDIVELPTICGEHVVYYPAGLVHDAMRGRFYAFGTTCECSTAYLIQTGPDGAHCRFTGTAERISELYESLQGEDILIQDGHGTFLCKRLPESFRPE
ncbi:hypothetical protein ACIBK9_51385 [Nonomuraea sp. NPDC050227]|uniref:hypothetical protein n=1 Tax=Nonomuraea sp. NPDC050227 TaxID=3364360 RepID=UPI00378EFE50